MMSGSVRVPVGIGRKGKAKIPARWRTYMQAEEAQRLRNRKIRRGNMNESISWTRPGTYTKRDLILVRSPLDRASTPIASIVLPLECLACSPYGASKHKAEAN